MEPRKLRPIFRHNERSESLWTPNEPDSLTDIAARACVFKHLNTWTRVDDDTKSSATPEGSATSGTHARLAIRPDICLPVEIVEKLMQVAQDGNLSNISTFLAMMKTTKLRKINLTDLSVTDEAFKVLLRHNVRQISIHNCNALTVQSLHALNRHSDELVSLHINTKNLLPDYLQPQGTFDDDDSDEERDGNIYEKQGYIIRAPKLRRLNIKNLFINRGPNFFELLLKPLEGLTHLDLSGCVHNQGLKDMQWLKYCPLLESLCLHNIKGCGWDRAMDSGLPVLTSLVHLQHLDISQAEDPPANANHPEEFLRGLATHLPKLMSLDISGTNLAGASAPKIVKGIPGLESRNDRPLDFLGLYKTYEDACVREGLPARVVTGDHTEQQIIEAGRRYINRPIVMEDIMNDLFHLIRCESFSDMKVALEILLQAMERHLDHKHVQISGSASLYYIVKSDILKRDMNVKVKQKALSVLLNGMLKHQDDPTMMRNGCLTLCQFQIPQDVLFDYERLVRILLRSVSGHTEDPPNFVQRAGIFLLNSVACQVDGDKKKLVGSLGAIEKMLDIIKEKLEAENCDDVMETAWSTMWNVTDETPANCDRFLKGNGMKLFLKCKAKFPDKGDLLRNMMGLLGNVAEVPELRPKLMLSEFVEDFSFLLDSSSDGIEVSYNAAGVLSHMASDGDPAWTIKSPPRSRVLNRMVRAIKRWNIDSRRNINYRSFEPIIRLLSVTHTPECQLWATWALANLTKVTPEKYCKLVVDEGGLSIIEDLILNENLDSLEPTRLQDVKDYIVREDVKKFAQIVRGNVLNWREQGCAVEEFLEYDG